LNAVNMASYATSFDTASFGSFSTEDEIQDARRVMAELVNASRYGSGDAEFIVARKSLGMFEQVLADLSGQDASEGGSKGTKAWEEAQKILSKNFTGTAKLLAAAEGDKADLDDTGKTSAGHSALTTPDALVAKDHMDTFSYGDFASVTSTADRGIHCRYKPKGSYGTMGNIIHLYPGSSHFKCEEEDRHKWQTLVPSIITKGGMASFLKFAPATNGFEIDRMSFNQPDVWVYLTKDVSSMSLGGAGDLDFQMSHGGQNVGLDARIGEDGLAGSGLARGMHVFARAQVYYHRPGAWQEMPNFFNPYWGARLAPKNAVSARLMNEMGLPESISRIISDNLWMH
ncbi:hypothetical protein KAI87_06725, partial [Myxococcota bacterium]|nr:hypothetical protein [Myxococcota bacterium]